MAKHLSAAKQESYAAAWPKSRFYRAYSQTGSGWYLTG